MTHFNSGFRAVIPIIPGIIPFGAVMGSAFAEANLSFWQAMLMNTTLYAGAAQLATTDLMKMNAACHHKPKQKRNNRKGQSVSRELTS